MFYIYLCPKVPILLVLTMCPSLPHPDFSMFNYPAIFNYTLIANYAALSNNIPVPNYMPISNYCHS